MKNNEFYVKWKKKNDITVTIKSSIEQIKSFKYGHVVRKSFVVLQNVLYSGPWTTASQQDFINTNAGKS